MNVTVEIGDQIVELEVPDALITEATEFFDKMDRDMNCGWQMSRWWVPDPDSTQRCQIVADKLLTSIQKDETESAMLMCAYILRAKPSTSRISINTVGEIQGNAFYDA